MYKSKWKPACIHCEYEVTYPREIGTSSIDIQRVCFTMRRSEVKTSTCVTPSERKFSVREGINVLLNSQCFNYLYKKTTG